MMMKVLCLMLLVVPAVVFGRAWAPCGTTFCFIHFK